MKEAPDFSTVSRKYDSISAEYDRAYLSAPFLREDAITARLLKRVVKSGERVLDLGCGTGKAVSLLDSSTDIEYVGVDISRGMLEKARATHSGRTFIQADVTALPFQDGHFDSVISTYGSLSHVLDLDLAVAEAARVLAPRGRLFVMLYGLHQARYPRRQATFVDEYQIRSMPDAPAIAARLIRASDLRTRLKRQFDVGYVRGLTFGPVPHKKLRGGHMLTKVYDIIDNALCYIRPDSAHTLVAFGTKR